MAPDVACIGPTRLADPVSNSVGPQRPDYAAALSRVAAELDHLIENGATDAILRRAAWTAALDQPMPETGVGAEAVIEEIATTLIPNGSRISDPRCWGWIVSVPGPVAIAASAAGSIAASQRYTINAFNLLEEVSLTWLAQLCGLDSTRMRGIYSSGGSVANLVALGAARQWAFEQRGVDPAADGVGGAPDGYLRLGGDAPHRAPGRCRPWSRTLERPTDPGGRPTADASR